MRRPSFGGCGPRWAGIQWYRALRRRCPCNQTCRLGRDSLESSIVDRHIKIDELADVQVESLNRLKGAVLSRLEDGFILTEFGVNTQLGADSDVEETEDVDIDRDASLDAKT